MKRRSLFKNPVLPRTESIVVNDVEVGMPIIEAYNRLRDNILYFSLDGNNKVIQVESSVSGEGKTTLISNLAVTLAKAGKKVVLMDLDYRKAKTHYPFKIKNENGSSDYLLGKVSYEEMVKHTEFGVDLINVGKETTNSASILTSSKLKNLVNKLKEEYDFVLLDCPPVLSVSDYIHIGQLSDCCLFAIAHGSTKKNQVKDAIAELKKNNINVMGIVYTFYNGKKDREGNRNYGYGYKNKRYGYGYGYIRKHKENK